MNTDKRFLSLLSASLITFSWAVTLFLFPANLSAEGSIDFINNDGFRLFYFAERQQQLKVYASEGEFINFGASHVGISSGFIKVYRPDGTLHSTYNNTGTSVGQAIINNNVEELNGPTGGGSMQGAGYIPGIVEVDPGEEGIWTVTLGYGFYQNSGFENLMNGEAWTREADQPTNRRVVLSWDITVSQNDSANAGGNMLTGRVFTNEYQSIVSENGNTTSPTFYLLTNEGLQFRIDYKDVDPWGFQITSNNKGIISGDNLPTYSSFNLDEVIRTSELETFEASKFYLYEPQAQDRDGIINNKVFFNLPDPNLPSQAIVTDIVRQNTHMTWLLNEVPEYEIEILDVALSAEGSDITDVLDRTNGAKITYRSNLIGSAQLVIDIDNDGVFGNNNDKIVNASAIDGENEIFWDGLDRQGEVLNQQFNRALSYRLRVNAGELHLTLSDIENDLGGVSLTRLNGNAPSDLFLYDHARIGGAVSGAGALPEPTSEPFTFTNNFGDLKMLDYWTYVASVSTISDLLLDVVDDISILPPDSDDDGVRDDNDIDNDNDGILDALEACAGLDGGNCFPNNLDPDFDEDFDGIPNYIDADDAAFDLNCDDLDGDGRCDKIPTYLDVDQDGIANHLDLDADNDGIVDILEASHTAQNLALNGKIVASKVEFGKNGLYNPLGTDDNILSAAVNYTISDVDGDLHPDAYDLDTDNDGLYDVAEANFGQFDINQDGILSADESNITINEDGIVSLIDTNENGNLVVLPFDNDGDKIFNFRDRDSDNDGISDVIEGRNPDANGDGVVGDGALETNELGVPIHASGETFTVRSELADHDNDNIADYRDLDSDNDGIYDVAEALLDDGNNDGFLSIDNLNVDQYGMVITGTNNTANYLSFAPDQDNDKVPNHLDRDSDNDGLNDVTEGGNEDPEDDGVLSLPNTTNVNEVGVVAAGQVTSSNTTNKDGDEFPDFLDLDADNDGIHDVIEVGNQDTNNDGRVDFEVNEYGQFILNNELGTTSSPKDFDKDGVPNYHDLDSDNDGLNDVLEGGNVDPDNDGVVGEGTPNLLADGRVTGSTSLPLDTDTDGFFDYEDLDADNDGIYDVYESNLADADNDGIIGSGPVAVDANGQVILAGNENANTSNPTDSDQDGIPNFRDLDSDNDTLSDVEECPDGSPCPDLNQSGESDYTEFTIVACPIPLIKPTVDHANSLCSSEMLSLTVNESDVYESAYPNQDVTYTWRNANAVVMTATTDPNYTLQGDDPLLILPITVVVSVDVDCASPASDPVNPEIKPTPLAVGSSEFERICKGGEVQLYAETVEGASYQWYFNTFPFSKTQNPMISSLNATTTFGIEVELNGCTSERDFVLIYAEEPPTIEALTGAGTYCAGEDITFTAINNNSDLTGNLSYTFSGPDGLMVDISVPADGTFEYTVPNVDFINGGNYSLIVDNGSGCASNTENYSVSVSEGPDQPVVDVLNAKLCPGEDIALSTQMYEGPNVSYEWSLNGSVVSTTSTPSLSINNVSTVDAGNYTVKVSTGDCGASTSAAVAVAITDTSIAPTIENNLSADNACTGQTVNLKVINPTPETIYTWYNPNGTVNATNVLEINIPNIQLAEAGSYKVEANIDNCVTLEDESDVQVTEGLTTPAFDEVMMQTCEGQDLNLTIDNFTSTSNTTYSWYKGNDVLIAETMEPNLTISNSSSTDDGDYYVIVTQGDCASGASNLVTIMVATPPNETADAGMNANYCQSAVINLEASMPMDGTGTWMSTTAQIVDVNNPLTEVSNLTLGDNMFVWVLDANGCLDYSRDTVIINVSEVPNETAAILNTANNICVSDANALILSADIFMEGQGEWNQVAGPSTITFNTQDETTTTVNGITPGTYTVEWSLSTSACGTFSDDAYTFAVDAVPNETAAAGPDESVCSGVTVFTQAVMPSIGMGQWSSNSGVVFSDVNDPNATLSELTSGENILTWTLSNGACENYDSDVVNIEVSTSPDEQATVLDNAIQLCESDELLLTAIMPNEADGNWIQIGGAPTTIINPSESETRVTYNAIGTFTYLWQLSTAECGTYSNAEVQVTIDATPSEMANAGNDQNTCGTDIELSATNVMNGSGFWSSNVGTINDPTDPNTTVSNLPNGNHIFTWTLSSGACQNYSEDEVMISTTEVPNEVAEVVNEVINICANVGNESVNLVAIDPAMSDGLWTQVSGPNATTINDDASAITSVDGLISGTYEFAWTLSMGLCADFSTDLITVNVDEIPTNVFANAGDNQTVCGGVNTTNLNAGNPPIGSGRWTIFNTSGASVDEVNNPNTEVTLMEGENIFVWSLSNGGCENYEQDTVSVFFTMPEEAATILTANIELCESDLSDITLNAADIEVASGVWSQVDGPNEATIDNPSNEEMTLSNLTAGFYTFQWSLSEENCINYATDMVTIEITSVPDEDANVAQDEVIVCGDNQTTIEAVMPSSSMGSWSTNSDAVLVNANSATTAINELQAGENIFTWSLSSGNCVDFSTADVSVLFEQGIQVEMETYIINTGTELLGEDLTTNIEFNGNTDWTITLIGNPTEVTLNDAGVFDFKPAVGFTGDYIFEYEICDVSCNTCERVTVKIEVLPPQIVDCDIPNILTPNNDNKNDALIIDCANLNENSKIQIFNRWGDKVYEKVTYENDWRGTYEGDDLPAGTYFYVFKKDQFESEAITGYITLIR